MKEILTIAIPTYNRVNHLIDNIDTILVQLNADCRLLIIDNHSSYILDDKISEILEVYLNKGLDIRVIRNNVNVGLFGNILKCFELCETKWLYIIGDDDRMTENGMSIILSDIKQFSDFINISYQWLPENRWSLERPKITTGAINYMESIESIHHVMFLSSNIYNVDKLNKFLSQGNYYQLTAAPHLVLLLLGLNDLESEKVYLSDKIVVQNFNSEVEEENKWNKPDFFRNIKLFLDLPIHQNNKKVLFKLYKKSYALKKYLRIYVQFSLNGTIANIREEFKIATSYYKIHGSYIDKLQVFVFSKLLFFPKLIKHLTLIIKK